MRLSFLLLALLCVPLANASDDTPEKLRAQIATEHDLVHKAKLEIKLADMVLEQTRKVYAEGDTEKGEAGITEMMSLAEHAYKDLFATHRDPRSRPGGFKDTEIRLRDMMRRLKDLKTMLATDERPAIDKAVTRLHEMHDDLLDGIMRIRKKEEQ